MASSGGDRGRDAELFTIEAESNTLFQFAVRDDWDAKVRETLQRLAAEFSSATSVVFLSSKQIGAKGDPVRARARKQGIALDIRDRSWFIERVDADASRSSAAAELARVIVDAYLVDVGVGVGTPLLEGTEAKTALVFLELQAKDDDTAKGLTKACYESLVRAALQGTTADKRKSRAEVRGFVAGLLPQHGPAQLAPFVDAALKRLERSAVKHHQRPDEFHLAYEEVERTKDRMASLALLQDAFLSDARDVVGLTIRNDEVLTGRAVTLVRTIIESYFYRLGEEFAQSVAGDRDIPLHADLLRTVTQEMAPTGTVVPKTSWADFLHSAATSIIANPSPATLELFRVLSTAYTLFAFLSEVPDVQRATKKLFEHGTLWFDTTVLLPLFAEQAFPDDMRPFTDLMLQLERTGLKLRATPGVIEEIEGHLNLCRHYLRVENWIGRVPYVYQRFALAGGTASGFNSWLDQFYGDFRPMEDLAQWLRDIASIESSAPPSFDALPKGLVDEVSGYWQDEHEHRRRDTEGGHINALRLAQHDTENYLSVVLERKVEPGKSLLGYTSWLVTMDSKAWRLLARLSRESVATVKHSPVMSLDFLLKYLSFGPRRDRVEPLKKGHARIFTTAVFESIPPDLIKAADQVRQGCYGLSERLVQRRVRDELDRRKMNAGAVQQAGLDGLEAAIESMFQ